MAASASASSAAAVVPLPAPKSTKKSKKTEKEDIGGIPAGGLVLAKWRDASWRRAVVLDKREPRSMRGEGRLESGRSP